MTLKEKTENAWVLYEHREGNLYSNCFKDGFELGLKEAEEFAIKFAEWYLNLWRTDDDSSFDNNSPQELLQIFKKEKGL